MSEELTGGIAEPTNPADGIAEPSAADSGNTSSADTGGIADAAGDQPAGKETGNVPEAPAEPEPYELKAPDGFPIPEANLSSFAAMCKDAKMTKEQAEKALAWHKSLYDSETATLKQQEQATLSGWASEISKDPDFGGAHMRQTVSDARRALDVFDTDGSLRALLRDSNYQYNPTIIRAVARVGRAMGEHGFVSQSGQGGDTKPLEERMYPNMKI